MERVIKFRALYEGVWHYQTLEEILTITLAAFRLGKHKTQYTGQKDKNGKEIYEGDIMKGSFATGGGGDSTRYKEFHFKVIFYETRGFIIDMPKNNGHYRFLPYLSSCEIVSTIYENPELLGK